MILEEKKFGLRSVLVLLEDGAAADIIARRDYDHLIITSYRPWDIPGFSLRQKTTALIPLNLAAQEIFAKFSDTTRNEIRRTEKNADLTFTHPSPLNDEAYALYKDFEYIQGRVPASRRKLAQCLFFGAYYRGELVSGLFLHNCFPYLRVRSIFSRRLQRHDHEWQKIISNASRRLMWEACLWGRAQNYEALDLASVNFHNPATANITKFKMSFGGEIVPEYTYSYSSPRYRLLERLIKIKKLLLKFR